jgi:hypothetical protein
MSRKESVVTYTSGAELPDDYMVGRNSSIAQMIAKFQGISFDGEFNSKVDRRPESLYFVPHKTLVGQEIASKLAIHSEKDLFGGFVPVRYLATKGISHGLIGPEAQRPEGWSNDVPEALKEKQAVLPGYTVFSTTDAYKAGERLLAQDGVVRMKKTLTTSGRGQAVVSEMSELARFANEVDPEELSQNGLVLEQNLYDVRAYSIGQITVGGEVVSYYGTIREEEAESGLKEYRGSDLTVTRGGFESLLKPETPEDVRGPILKARAYDDSLSLYPEVIASRRNYDIGHGADKDGNAHTIVFEQSWRIGGASAPEIAALQVLHDDPGIDMVRASSYHEYGDGKEAPEGAIVHYQGKDMHYGPMIIYTRLIK